MIIEYASKYIETGEDLLDKQSYHPAERAAASFRESSCSKRAKLRHPASYAPAPAGAPAQAVLATRSGSV